MTALNFGMAYPKGDEDALFALGDAWNQAAADLEKLEPDLKNITGQLPQYYVGAGAVAVADEFNILLGSGDHSIHKLIESLEGMGHDARSTATEIEYTKIQEEIFALLTLATVASLLWSFAGSAAAPAVLAAAREGLALFAQNAMKRIAAIIARSGLKTLAKPLSREIIIPLGERIAPAAQRIAALNERIAASSPLIRYPAAIVKGGLGAGLMGAGLDAGTQGLQILEGHRDDGYDLKRTFQTALQWGAGGAAGGPAHELMANLLKSRVSPFTTKFVSGTVGGAVGAGGMYAAGLGTQLYDSGGDWNKVDKTFHPQLLIGGLAMGAMAGANHGLTKEHVPSAPTMRDTGVNSSPHPSGARPEVSAGLEQPNRLQPQELHQNSGGEQPAYAQPNESAQQPGVRANTPVVDSPARPGTVNMPETRTPPGDHARPLDSSTKLSSENATRPTISNDRAGDATASREATGSRPTADSPARASATQPDVKANIAAGKQDLVGPLSANRSTEVRPVAGVPGTDAPGVHSESAQRRLTDAVPDKLSEHPAPQANEASPIPDRTRDLTDESRHEDSSSTGRPTRDQPVAPLPYNEHTAPTTNRNAEHSTGASVVDKAERPAALSRESDQHALEPTSAHPAETPPAEGDWSPRPNDDWSRMNPKEVSDELARRWDIDTTGFDNPNLHPEAVREFARAVDEMLTRYPDVDLPKLAIEPMEMVYYAETVPRYFSDGRVATDRVVLNEHYAVDPELMAREIAEDEAGGHLVPGSSDRPIHSTLVHEFAHAIFFEGQERASDTAKYALANHFESTRGGLDRAGFEEWVDQLSGYSFDKEGVFNPDEALAEAFTDVEYNGASAAEPAKVLYWHLLDNANQHSRAPTGFARIPEHTIARPVGAHTADSFGPKQIEPESLSANKSQTQVAEQHQPAPTPPSTKVTQELRDNVEELRNRAREVLNAHDGLARVDELPDLRRQYVDQLDVIGLREPETAAAAWALFNEYDPALAKYLVDYAHDLLPPTETAVSNVQLRQEPNGQYPASEVPADMAPDPQQHRELEGPAVAPEFPSHDAERTEAGLSFHPEDPEIADLARRVGNDPSYVTVDVHTTEDGNIRVGHRTYTPEEFGDFLRQLGYDSRMPLRLIGCDAVDNGVAARLAAHLGADVLAPTKPAWTDRQGRVYTSTPELDSNGRRRPRIPPDGEWKLVHPDGASVKASEDGFAPGTHEEDKRNIDPENSRERDAPSDAEWHEIARIYDALGEEPPRVNLSENDIVYAVDGAHSVERHGPDVPLNQVDAAPGERTIEGRIYGDPPWPRPENWSYRWSDTSTMNRTINDYLRANWDNIRSDLALYDFHKATFDAGHLTGEGFYNEGMFAVGPRSARYAQTSFATVVLRLVPGDPPSFMVITAYPSGLP